LVIWSCLHIAEYFKVPEVVIDLTIVAIGTSLPEIVTCITAARKGEGEIAAGDIIGADILNILWIIGVSAMVWSTPCT
jgi:cation:H+ antiporter